MLPELNFQNGVQQKALKHPFKRLGGCMETNISDDKLKRNQSGRVTIAASGHNRSTSTRRQHAFISFCSDVSLFQTRLTKTLRKSCFTNLLLRITLINE